MDLLVLSRLQFGLTTAFHILFPTLTIGLAFFLFLLEVLWLKSRAEIYYRMYRFWVKIFALNFAVGVVSGITLEFEFGTNFAEFSRAVGNVLGPLFAYEGLTAFFLEAGFLGIMLFGWNRVPPLVHFLATSLVTLGAALSGFWIMAANSWMQTPRGAILEKGIFHVTSFRDVIFNPSMPTHLAHMLAASLETTAFVIAGVSAFFLLKGRQVPFYRKSLAVALILAAVMAPFQVLLGDLKGRNTAIHQPIKLAAMEAHWKTNDTEGAPFLVFALPDNEAERNHGEVKIPYLLSLIMTHSVDGRIEGLTSVPADERPDVRVTFFSFRVMAGIGFLFLFIMIWGGALALKKKLFDSKQFLIALVLVHPLGFIATITGWITTEMGRQPWIVQGLMKTEAAVSPIAAGNVLWSLVLFICFFGLTGSFYAYYLLKLFKNGPDLNTPIPALHFPKNIIPFYCPEKETA